MKLRVEASVARLPLLAPLPRPLGGMQESPFKSEVLLQVSICHTVGAIPCFISTDTRLEHLTLVQIVSETLRF